MPYIMATVYWVLLFVDVMVGGLQNVHNRSNTNGIVRANSWAAEDSIASSCKHVVLDIMPLRTEGPGSIVIEQSW